MVEPDIGISVLMVTFDSAGQTGGGRDKFFSKTGREYPAKLSVTAKVPLPESTRSAQVAILATSGYSPLTVFNNSQASEDTLNEYAPEITGDLLVNITEDTPPRVITGLKPFDRDSVNSSLAKEPLTLTIDHPNATDDGNGTWKLHPFSIDQTGEVRLLESLDYEASTHQFAIDVTLSDHGPPFARTTRETLRINLVDVNDNAPVFSSNAYAATLSYGLPEGTALLRLRASDEDSNTVLGGENARLSYSIDSGDPEGYFSCDPDSGKIAVAKQLPRTESTAFTLSVRAIDHGKTALHDNATVTLAFINDDYVVTLKTEPHYDEFVRNIDPVTGGNVCLNVLQSVLGQQIFVVEVRRAAGSDLTELSFYMRGKDGDFLRTYQILGLLAQSADQISRYEGCELAPVYDPSLKGEYTAYIEYFTDSECSQYAGITGGVPGRVGECIVDFVSQWSGRVVCDADGLPEGHVDVRVYANAGCNVPTLLPQIAAENITKGIAAGACVGVQPVNAADPVPTYIRTRCEAVVVPEVQETAIFNENEATRTSFTTFTTTTRGVLSGCVACPGQAPACVSGCQNCTIRAPTCDTCPAAVCVDSVEGVDLDGNTQTCVGCLDELPTCGTGCASNACNITGRTCDACPSARCLDVTLDSVSANPDNCTATIENCPATVSACEPGCERCMVTVLGCHECSATFCDDDRAQLYSLFNTPAPDPGTPASNTSSVLSPGPAANGISSGAIVGYVVGALVIWVLLLLLVVRNRRIKENLKRTKLMVLAHQGDLMFGTPEPMHKEGLMFTGGEIDPVTGELTLYKTAGAGDGPIDLRADEARMPDVWGGARANPLMGMSGMFNMDDQDFLDGYADVRASDSDDSLGNLSEFDDADFEAFADSLLDGGTLDEELFGADTAGLMKPINIGRAGGIVDMSDIFGDGDSLSDFENDDLQPPRGYLHMLPETESSPIHDQQQTRRESMISLDSLDLGLETVVAHTNYDDVAQPWSKVGPAQASVQPPTSIFRAESTGLNSLDAGDPLRDPGWEARGDTPLSAAAGSSPQSRLSPREAWLQGQGQQPGEAEGQLLAL